MKRPALMAVSAHPDDIEIGAFGSLHRWRERFDIHLVVATEGERGEAESVPRDGPGVTGCRRVLESERAAEILEAEVCSLGLPDGYLRDDLTTVSLLEEMVHKIQPQRVLVNFYDDTHQDHRSLARAMLSASRSVPEILLYETPWTTCFQPSFFVDITSTIDRKLECIAIHASQSHRSYTAESYTLGVAAVHGARIGLPGRYVEAFHVYRMVEP